MAHLLSKVWKIALSGFVTFFVLSACLTLTPASSGTTPTYPAGTPTQDGLSVSVVGDVAFGPGSFNLTEPRVGLADLASYKATLTLSFAGTQDGKSQQWSKTYVMLTMKEPPTRQLTIDKSGDNSDPVPVFMAEAGGAAYERRGTNACNATVIDPGNSLADRWEPAASAQRTPASNTAGFNRPASEFHR